MQKPSTRKTSSTFPDPNGRNAAAWAFVMEPDRARIIVRTVSKLIAKTPGMEHAELYDATLLRCVEDFEKFNPAAGSFQTWVHWQAMRERQTLQRMHGREDLYPAASERDEHDRLDPVACAVAVGAWERISARAELRGILATMPENVLEAVKARADGLSGPEIERTLGITRKGCARRIQRWRDSLDTPAPV